MKEVFGETKTKKVITEATYPNGYPFKVLHDLVENCKDVVKFFHNCHLPKSQLRDLQTYAGKKMLVRAAPTRWGAIQAMVAALLDSERLLHALVLACDFVHGMAAQKAECTKLPTTITDDNFFNNLYPFLMICVLCGCV